MSDADAIRKMQQTLGRRDSRRNENTTSIKTRPAPAGLPPQARAGSAISVTDERRPKAIRTM
jgi:hypothetical protein